MVTYVDLKSLRMKIKTRCSMSKMTVSVVFITYNHEKYVRRALLSVLNQETDFPFEVVVGEDCSTDSTREILTELKEQYPEKVRLLFREKNLGRPTLNVYQTTMACTGEYIAYLEGDDYWDDTHKLQKQVDFLKAHPEYIAVTHACRMIDENGDDITDPEALSVGEMYAWSGWFTFEDFKYSGKWPGHYATVLSRNIYLEGKYDYTILYRAHDFVDDGVILLFLLIQGNIYRMDEVMSAWRYVRKKEAGNWNSLSMQRNIIKEDCYLIQNLMKWCEESIGLTDYSIQKAQKDFETALNMYLHHPKKENLQFVKDMFAYNIKEVVRKGKKTSLFGYCVKTVWNKLCCPNIRRRE